MIKGQRVYILAPIPVRCAIVGLEPDSGLYKLRSVMKGESSKVYLAARDDLYDQCWMAYGEWRGRKVPHIFSLNNP